MGIVSALAGIEKRELDAGRKSGQRTALLPPKYFRMEGQWNRRKPAGNSMRQKGSAKIEG